jgi:ribosome-binding factor A
LSGRRPAGKTRGARVDELVRQVISEALVGMADPRLRLVTITGAKTTRDSAYADVWFQVHGGEKRAEKALAGLEAARGLLQQRVNAELHLRRTPILRFYLDPSLEEGQRIEQILREAGTDT